MQRLTVFMLFVSVFFLLLCLDTRTRRSGSHDGRITHILRSRAGNVTFLAQASVKKNLPKIRFRDTELKHLDAVTRKALRRFKLLGYHVDSHLARILLKLSIP